MQKLFVLFFLTLSLMGFNSSVYAASEGVQSTDQEQATTDGEKKKKKKGGDDEEPECE